MWDPDLRRPSMTEDSEQCRSRVTHHLNQDHLPPICAESSLTAVHHHSASTHMRTVVVCKNIVCLSMADPSLANCSSIPVAARHHLRLTEDLLRLGPRSLNDQAKHTRHNPAKSSINLHQLNILLIYSTNDRLLGLLDRLQVGNNRANACHLALNNLSLLSPMLTCSAKPHSRYNSDHHSHIRRSNNLYISSTHSMVCLLPDRHNRHTTSNIRRDRRSNAHPPSSSLGSHTRLSRVMASHRMG
jgi:hypothetical protein